MLYPQLMHAILQERDQRRQETLVEALKEHHQHVTHVDDEKRRSEIRKNRQENRVWRTAVFTATMVGGVIAAAGGAIAVAAVGPIAVAVTAVGGTAIAITSAVANYKVNTSD